MFAIEEALSTSDNDQVTHIRIYIDAYIYTINLWTAAASLFESSSAMLRSNETLKTPESPNYCYSCEC